jgi:integrase
LDRRAASITQREAIRTFDALKAGRGASAANRCLAYGRAAYGWAVSRQLLEANPLAGLARPGEERSRERVLSRDELLRIWAAADALGPIHGSFVRLLMLTLARRSEVAAMRWAELSDDLAAWELPSTRSKNKRPHITHLAEPARTILRRLPRVESSPFVFGPGGKAIAGFSFIKRALDQRADVPAWCFHDLRRAGATHLCDMGVAQNVCDRLLNHIGGTLSAVGRVYQKSELATERRRALELWAQLITEEPADNIVQFGRHG